MKQYLKDIILSQAERLKQNQPWIERQQFTAIEKSLELPHASVVSGIRRCGKSTLLTHLSNTHYNNNVYHLNFEDERLLSFQAKDFTLLHETFSELYGRRQTFFLDEIQNIPGWERFVRRLQDDGYKFLLTGSNASLLSQELGTKLTGRHVDTELFPFSFAEYLRFVDCPISTDDLHDAATRGELKRQFALYIEHGGMPEYLHYRDPNLLITTYEDILYRDVIIRHNIHDIRALREIALYLLSNISSLYSHYKIKNMTSIGSVNTVKNYIEYLENAYLLFSINQYSDSLRQQTVANKKIYAIDNGLANAVAFQFSKNYGHFLENLVFLQLRRHNKEVFYYKTRNNLEVDFIIRQGRDIHQLIQVAEHIDSPKTKQREINALTEAMEETGLTEGYLLTGDTTDTITINQHTIHVLPVYQWLIH